MVIERVWSDGVLEIHPSRSRKRERGREIALTWRALTTSGFWASKYIVHVKTAAVVSCPAIKRVIKSSRSCLDVTSSPDARRNLRIEGSLSFKYSSSKDSFSVFRRKNRLTSYITSVIQALVWWSKQVCISSYPFPLVSDTLQRGCLAFR